MKCCGDKVCPADVKSSLLMPFSLFLFDRATVDLRFQILSESSCGYVGVKLLFGKALRVYYISLETQQREKSSPVPFFKPRARNLIMSSTYTSTILITGGTFGIGYQASLAIARQHSSSLIIIASRNDTNSASQTINSTLGQKNVTFLPLDLGNLENIRTFATHFSNSNYPPISHLVLNAVLQFADKEIHKTSDGFETTFGIAHVGHALLFHLLFPLFAPEARVLVTSSGTHDPAQKTGLPDAKYTSAEEIAHPPAALVRKEGGRGRYTTTKLCNVLWTYALARRFEKLSSQSGGKRKLTVVAFDPGLVPGTGLGREARSLEKFLWHRVMPHVLWLIKLVVGSKNVHTGPEAGENMAFVVAGERVKGSNGVYFEERGERKSSKESYDEQKQEELWLWTVKTVARDEDERAKFDIGK
jgi:NAD(P)-dependent dehydrogenase (short-subunit alcohol dehydrogenase family)